MGDDDLREPKAQDKEGAKGKKPEKAEGDIPEPESIDHSEHQLRDVILPVLVIVVAMIVVIAAINWIQPNCQYNGFFYLAFAVLFGAAGSLFGGKIGILLNAPGTAVAQGGIKAVGGIGAAIAGWVIAALSFPECIVTWNGQITIDQIPMAQPQSGDDSPRYFVTTSVLAQGQGAKQWNERPDVLFSLNNDNRTLLQFRLASTGNRIVFRMYRKEADKDPAADPKNPRTLYSFIGSCQLALEPGGPDEEKSSDRLTNTADKVSLRFRETYLDTLKEKNDLAVPGAVLNKCVDGWFADSNDKKERTFQNPLFFRIEKGSFGGEKITLSFKKSDTPPDLQTSTALNESTVKSAKEVAAVHSPGGTEILGAPGSTGAIQVPASDPAAAPTPAGGALEQTANCVSDTARRAATLSYLAGGDLDQTQRFDLYRSWDQLSCLALAVLANDGGKFTSQNQGRALRLLASTIINNSGTANATYWQQNSGKRDFSQSLPAYVDPKYLQLIVNLTGVDDNYIRAEAVRFIKLLPGNQVEALFRDKYRNIASQAAGARREYFAIAAAALYYNRIVEWLNVADADKAAAKNAANDSIAKDFAASQAWMQDDLFNGRSAKPFLAMLLYGRAIVERELTLRDDRGRADFVQMLSVLKLTSDPYPSRAQHIGQALVFTSGLADGSPQLRSALRAVQAASEFDLVRVMDGKPPFSATPYQLSPAPDLPLSGTTLSSADNARVLLQSADWYLVTGIGKIGWIKSPQPG